MIVYFGLKVEKKKHYNISFGAGSVPKYVPKVKQTFKEAGI